MIEVHTESGAVYHLDTDNGLSKRLSGPEVRERKWDDDTWESMTLVRDLEVGESMTLWHEDGFRVTTPVVSFQEIPD